MPVEGRALWGKLSGAPNCIVNGSNIRRVQFYLNNQWINTDSDGSNGFGCAVNLWNYADGAYTLKAVAYDSSGRTATATRAFLIQNAGSPPVPSGLPAIAWHVPTQGGELSGDVRGKPWCAVTGYKMVRVQFYLNGTLFHTDSDYRNGFSCFIDTRAYPDGTYALKAIGYHDMGTTATAEIAVQFKNGSGGGALPSLGATAVPTFESLGVYWKPPSNPGAAGCQMTYRKAGATEWKQGLSLWYDGRNGECRGSLVHLTPGTDYEVQLALPGQQPIAQISAKTWAENFPIANVVQLSGTRTTPLNITQGGTASGYVLYTGPGTIDVGNAYDNNVVISAPYVIVRGLTLRGARVDAVRLLQGARDVVIEDNDISGWGRDSGTVSTEGWRIGVNIDSGIKADCGSSPWLVRTVIQRNRIHHPRYGTNSWSDGHPLGPNATYFGNCGGNHVFRHNEIYSDWGRYFKDGYGGADNFSSLGVPNADSDIYGNRVSQVWDDAIEAEGANRNVRIWSNYADQTAIAIATSATHTGPVYIFRNVQNRSRMLAQSPPDNDEQLGRAFAKSGSSASFGGGARYVFHNTLLQAPPLPGSQYTQGAGIGLKGNGTSQPMTMTVSRNNIYHIQKSWLTAIEDSGGGGNSLDYDLFNGTVAAYPGAEANGIVGTPIYRPGHGWENEWGGFYQLEAWSPGYDRGVVIPNFNDGYTGAAPDTGAHEAGTAGMRFGVGAGAAALQ